MTKDQVLRLSRLATEQRFQFFYELACIEAEHALRKPVADKRKQSETKGEKP
jgi:hypothetical protein